MWACRHCSSGGVQGPMCSLQATNERIKRSLTRQGRHQQWTCCFKASESCMAHEVTQA